MPRKKKEKENQEEGKEKKKGSGKLVSFLIVLLFLLLWIATFAFLIKLDVGNLGTSLRPMLRNVPVLKYLLPSVSPEVEAYENNYPYFTLEDAIQKIIELEKENDGLQAEIERMVPDYQQRIAELETENARLKVFEEDQLAFAKRVEEFDRTVVFGENAPDISEYKKFYEEINPVTAEQIYRQVIEKLQYDELVQTEAKRLATMRPSSAAAILEEMTASIDLVAEYLMCMKLSESAAILQRMDSLYAAHILQKIADKNAEAMEQIRNAIGISN